MGKQIMKSLPAHTLRLLLAMAGSKQLTPSDKLAGIDIEAEYKLIQKKKCRLSRRFRDLVVYRYENQNFKSFSHKGARSAKGDR